MSSSTLTELVLTSTPANSPLPLTTVQNPITGQVVFSFKSPPPPSTTTTSTTTSANGKGKRTATEEGSQMGQTMSLIPAGNGCGAVLFGLGGKDGRASINVWNLTREATQQRLVPPVRLNTIATSPDGVYLAGGTHDGRVFLWEISTGTLVATLDAHYRSVSCLAFTHDGAAMITASEDAGVSVWSLGRILTSTPMSPPTPFATLSDHTLSITCLSVGLGTFPNCRVFTGSLDGTVKIWDLSTTPATLLTTFQFPHPVHHLTVDTLERFFFVAGPIPSASSASSAASTAPSTAASKTEGKSSGSKVTRINLYRPEKEQFGISSVRPVGGSGSAGEIERVGEEDEPGMTYSLTESIATIHLSPHSPTLYVTTSQSSQTHVLSLPAMLPTRILTPPPSSTGYGGLTFCTTFVHSLETNRTTAGAGGGGLGGEGIAGSQRDICSQLGRTVQSVEERERGGKNGRYVSMRIGGNGGGLGLTVEELIQPARGLDSLPSFDRTFGGSDLTMAGGGGGGSGGGGGQAAESDRQRIEELEKEVELLKKSLGKAVGINERVWKGVVEAGFASSGGK